MRVAADGDTIRVANKRKSAAVERVQAKVRVQRVRTHEVPASCGESAGFVSRGEPQGTFEGSQIVNQSSS